METSLFECIGHPDAVPKRPHGQEGPWWHYFERVPIKGGPVPKHWVDAAASRSGKKVHSRCNDRGQVPMVRCKQCKGRVRNTIRTSHDKCFRCRKSRQLANQNGAVICTSCWTNDPIPGKKTCQRCLETRKKKNAERRRLEREW